MVRRTSLPPERDALVDRAVAQLAGGRSMLLYGVTGIGKSHVGSIVMRRIDAMVPSWRIRITSGGTHFVAGVLEAEGDSAASPPRLAPSSIEQIESLLASSTPPAVIHIDDAHQFDERHIDWLVSLVERAAVALLIAVNTDDGIDNAATVMLSRLWVDEIADRADLEPLDREQTDNVVASLAEGTPIDLATRVGVYHASGGNPLLIRELVRELMSTGLVTGSASTFIYPLPPTPSKRLVDIVWHRLRTLADDERNSLVLLARLEGLPVERAYRYAGREVVRRLIRAGLVLQHESTGSIRMAHRIEPEVVLSVTGDAQSARTSLDVARLMREDVRAGVHLSARETVMLAEVLVGGDHDLASASEQDDLALVLLDAANISLASGTIYSGLSFARASTALKPSVAASVAESGCLRAMGNLTAAVAVLDDAERAVSSADERGLLIRWRVRFGSWIGTPVIDGGTSVGSDPDDGLEQLARAMDQVMQMEWDAARQASATVVWNTDAHELTRLQALEIHLVCLARAGRGPEFDRAVALGDRLAAGLRAAEPWQGTLVRTARAAYFASRAIAQITAGRSMSELSDELVEQMDDALTQHEYTRVSVLSALVGYMALCRSDPDTAEVELRLARDRWMVIPDARWQVWIVALHAESLLGAGRTDEAQEELARSQRDTPAGSSLRIFATGWGRADSGSAIAAANGSGPADVPDEIAPSAELSQMVVRIDRGEDAAAMVKRAMELRDRTDLELLRGLSDIVIGVAGRDAQILQTAAKELADVSYFGFAALAETRAGALLAASGQRMATATSESQAREYRRSQRRPFSEGAGLPLDLAGLTIREREIVLLIAAGRTNRDVADALFLSVRTVESHFYQARMKLGAVSRQELMRRVATGARD